jgi:hypothetical protein
MKYVATVWKCDRPWCYTRTDTALDAGPSLPEGWQRRSNVERSDKTDDVCVDCCRREDRGDSFTVQKL